MLGTVQSVKGSVEELGNVADGFDKPGAARSAVVQDHDHVVRSVERLNNVVRYVDSGNQRISSQKSLIGRLKANRQDARMAEITLSNLVEIQTLF
jgi:hypothetical protein